MATYESRRYNTPVTDVTKIADGSVNNTEFEHLDGVTSDIQTQLGSKLNLSGGALTGALSTNNNISLGDADSVIFGAGQDMKLFSDGIVGYVYANDLRLQSMTGENYVTAAVNGSANLWYDNANKLQTTANGINVTGTVDGSLFNGNGSNLTSLNASNLSSGTVPVARLPAEAIGGGKVLKVGVFTNQSQFDTTSNIPADGTTPTISEGVQVASRTFTPTATNSQLIHVLNVFTGGNSGEALSSFSIFRGNTNIGSFADITGDSGHFHCVMGQTVESSAATTSQITYTIRFGTQSNTVYWNRASGTNGFTGTNPNNSSLRWIIYEIGA